MWGAENEIAHTLRKPGRASESLRAAPALPRGEGAHASATRAIRLQTLSPSAMTSKGSASGRFTRAIGPCNLFAARSPSERWATVAHAGAGLRDPARRARTRQDATPVAPFCRSLCRTTDALPGRRRCERNPARCRLARSSCRGACFPLSPPTALSSRRSGRTRTSWPRTWRCMRTRSRRATTASTPRSTGCSVKPPSAAGSSSIWPATRAVVPQLLPSPPVIRTGCSASRCSSRRGPAAGTGVRPSGQSGTSTSGWKSCRPTAAPHRARASRRVAPGALAAGGSLDAYASSALISSAADEVALYLPTTRERSRPH